MSPVEKPSLNPAIALLAIVLVVAGAVGGAMAQSPPGAGAGMNGTNGSNTTNTTNGTNTTALTNTTATNATDTANQNVTNTTALQPMAPSVPGSPGSGGSGFVDGIVNGTVEQFNRLLSNTVGWVLLLPWQLITVRFAPFNAAADAASGPGGLFTRPNVPVYGALYDLALGSLFGLAGLLFVVMFVLDWFGNFSPRSSIGALDRLFLRAADVLHLLFSWPIAWGHFLLASALCAVFLPSRQEVVGGLIDYWSQLAGGATLVAFAAIFSLLALVLACYFVIKHGGAFVYLIIGLAAYPLLVAASIPDHWILGRLSEYAENARSKFPVAAWYPVPTAIVLGIGYAIDGQAVEVLTLGGPIGRVGGGGIYYPLLWFTALYAPVKVFGEDGVGRQAKRAAMSAGAGAIAGGAAGSATGAASGASAGTASSSGGALASGATSAKALPESRMSGSAGSATLAGDGGVAAAKQSSGTAGPTLGGSGSSRSGESAAGSSPVDATTPSRDALNTTQRYEPVYRRSGGDFQRFEHPRNAEWLVDKGGVEAMDNTRAAQDRDVFYRGETDGTLYDLHTAAIGSSDSTTQQGRSYATNDGSDSVRNT